MMGILHNYGCVNRVLPEPSLLDLVSLAGGALDRRVLDTLRAQGFDGLTVRHGYVFQVLLTGPRSVTALARSLRVSQQAMSKTVAELARGGYVEVATDPHDTRRRTVTLSPRAQAAIAAARSSRARLLDEVVARAGGVAVGEATAVMQALLTELDLAGDFAARSVPDPVEGARLDDHGPPRRPGV
jgi:DNA-binding MarR family transcriptional regulator